MGHLRPKDEDCQGVYEAHHDGAGDEAHEFGDAEHRKQDLDESAQYDGCYQIVESVLAHYGRNYQGHRADRKSTRLNSSHVAISYAVFCLKNKKYTFNSFPNL